MISSKGKDKSMIVERTKKDIFALKDVSGRLDVLVWLMQPEAQRRLALHITLDAKLMTLNDHFVPCSHIEGILAKRENGGSYFIAFFWGNIQCSFFCKKQNLLFYSCSGCQCHDTLILMKNDCLFFLI